MDHYTRKNFVHTQSIGFLLARARNLLASDIDAALKDLDISSQQMGIIVSLSKGTASTPFELSKLLGIDTGLMTRMLDKLEEKGLLERSRDDKDRRVVNLTLTRAGTRVADAIPDIVPPVLNAHLKSFTRAEFEELRRLLGKFLGE
ncbi:MarR family transcriptional regulator [Luteibacter sp. OK325]|uniref:MarR family winged helix-turn-helix transcriptional regulator n=1 Tax=Luteibacter sp. OK325 TaxID=2135670 RepID=UPI000D3BDB26|nr:MarR family transcriptional regulator [Luteibacter sp. OK325]